MAKSFPNTGATVGLAADRTAMTSMLEGQEFFETDTNKMFVYSGSAWVQTNSWSTTSGVTGVSNLIVPPMVRAIRTADQTLTSASTTAIQFTASDEFDTDAMHDTSTNTNRITINTAGVYIITATVNIASANSTGTYRLVAIRKNGSNEIATQNPGAIQDARVTVTVTDLAAISDYYEAVVYQDSGSSCGLNTIGSIRAAFTAAWVGPVS